MEKCPLLQVSCTYKCDVDEMPRNEVPETGSIFVKQSFKVKFNSHYYNPIQGGGASDGFTQD